MTKEVGGRRNQCERRLDYIKKVKEKCTSKWLYIVETMEIQNLL
jgi:hypothetical protein